MPKYRIKCVDCAEKTSYIDTDDYMVARCEEGGKGFILHYLHGGRYRTTSKLKSCLKVTMREEYQVLLPGDASPDPIRRHP